ncbi:MAG: uroporphyrinogen methyltransferase / synthase [Chloroflexota bacterium]|jgi:uroporphyrinogen III methyltransferase/synthase|nr:uroporphyrinogen methyltransferase / synthase [Chloroflexota bacterium]
MSSELAGKRVLVTRTEGKGGSLTEGLAAMGAFVTEVPLIVHRPPTDPEAARESLAAAGTYDYAILTSARAVGASLKLLGNDSPRGGWPPVLAVGPATARAARQAGLSVRLVPAEFVAEGLLRALDGMDLAGKRLIFPRAEVAREDLPEELRRRGATVDVVPVYRTEPSPDAPARLREALEKGVDMVALASASAAASLAQAAAGLQVPPVACIGPVAADAARTLGLDVAVVAGEHTAEGLVDAISRHFGRAA